MTDLERRLQEAAMEESATYVPSADLPERIERRVRTRRMRARALAGGAVAVGAAVVAVLALQLPGDDEQGVVANDPSSTTSTTTEASTTTTTASTTTTSTTTTAPPPPPPIDATTPLHAKGVGPIEAGMTVAEAEAATGHTFGTSAFDDFGGYCYFVELREQPDLTIRVERSGPDPVTDPRDGLIVVVGIYDLDPDGRSGRLTDAGIGLGSTEGEVRQAHGGAVDEQPHDYVPGGAYLYVHPAEAPGYGIRYVLDQNRVVTSIDVGLEGSITAPEGCA